MVPVANTKNKMSTFRYATDSSSGELSASSLDAAYTLLRAKITDEMIGDGGTLWVEDQATGERLTLGIDRD